MAAEALDRTGCRGRARAAQSLAFPLTVTAFALFSLLAAGAAAQPPATDWYMAGANPARTSWVSTEVRGDLKPVWQVPIEPYVSPRIQVVATDGRLFLSTARGLYCFSAASGDLQWVYPTSLPLGNSPTVVNGVAYVGGFDRRVHAVNVSNGSKQWTSPQAGAGFQTNPLVLNGRVIAGNRDGSLYAYDAGTGALLWKFQTEGPILFSAAAYDGKVYFVSNDSRAYAVTETGTLAWKSAKLPGQGFNSWWPVIYRDPSGNTGKDRIIISGSANYRAQLLPGGATAYGDHLHFAELLDVYPDRTFEPVGTVGAVAGPWPTGTPTLSVERIQSYFAQKPWRRTVFVLDPLTGTERETAPVLLAWTHSGTRFPPVVGPGGALYQQMNHVGGDWIASGSVGAWAPGVAAIAPATADPRNGEFAADEPVVSAGGGRIIYSSLCCDRLASAYDATNRSQRWVYYGYNLDELAPGYNASYFWNGRNYEQAAITVSFGPTGNGVYGVHGDQNPPIPYAGKVYFHRGNSLIALAPPAGVAPVKKPVAASAPASSVVEPQGVSALTRRLEEEVAKIIAAGHLRPGYTSHGLFDHAGEKACGDRLSDYWHTPSDTLYPLLRALPFVSSATRPLLEAYIKSEFSAFPPYSTDHVGWQGAAREIFDTPPEVIAQMAASKDTWFNWLFDGSGGWELRGVWGRNPMLFYVLWKYAQAFGNAAAIYSASRSALESPPDDTVLAKNPFAANAFIAGYIGYLQLEKLAGAAETASARATLDRLLALRKSAFTKDSPYKAMIATNEQAYCQQMSVATNFMFLVPELADYMRTELLAPVRDAVQEYESAAPYWFVALTSDGLGENAVTPMYDRHALFQAKAIVLKEPPAEMERFLDVPGFARGDMYFLQNLVTVIEAYGNQPTLSPPRNVRIVR